MTPIAMPPNPAKMNCPAASEGEKAAVAAAASAAW